MQSEWSIHSSVCVNVKGFIVPLLQEEVDSKTGHGVTGRSKKNITRGKADWICNKCQCGFEASVLLPVQLRPFGRNSFLMNWIVLY